MNTPHNPTQENSKISVLEVYDIINGTRRPLCEFEGVIEAPNWLPDGDTILYNAQGRLYRYSISENESSLLEVGAQKRCNNDHVISPDGSLLGFSCALPDESEWTSRIFMMPYPQGNPRMVTNESPSFLHGISHDNQEFAYCAFREGKVDIYVNDPENDNERCLTDGIGYNDGAEYSPDDAHIWFNSTRSGLMQIFRMDRDGSNLTQITSGPRNHWFPHISPDGKKVIYLTFREVDLEPWQHLPDKEVSLWMMDYDGTNQKKLADVFGGQGTINVNSWAPDSRRFAFVSYHFSL